MNDNKETLLFHIVPEQANPKERNIIHYFYIPTIRGVLFIARKKIRFIAYMLLQPYSKRNIYRKAKSSCVATGKTNLLHNAIAVQIYFT